MKNLDTSGIQTDTIVLSPVVFPEAKGDEI